MKPILKNSMTCRVSARSVWKRFVRVGRNRRTSRM
ncbi:hypothetical protein EVA_18634 [gut metagenome]|uniref:Uncharacterized protein n=1 Tax=gut metagenome TaxID=749906 RepID=J9FFP4_9ZZZZ